MGVLGTVKEFLRASTESPNRGDPAATESKGAYWCHDCSERVRDVEVAGESALDCPACGDEMEFERSPDSTGCAC
ncbi:zinc-ribbon domain-containing protein [Halorussus aquaticus]|uniref:Zinc-ribbon domain-containing protein n=1 Tax=Halorussus aquaticus TaxID=2953748 RepID=A0ABD5Q715_9EURY|nr:zinc-ribbon domain-containing protein [Halorussus aquaticus]